MGLRAYIVKIKDDEHCYAIAAENAKEAKLFARTNDKYDMFDDCDYTEICLKWRKDIDASKFTKGHIDELEALKLGVYGYLEDWPCPVCGDDGMIMNYGEGNIHCGCKEL